MLRHKPTPKKRLTYTVGQDVIVKNLGDLRKKILIGIPTLGVVRIEFDIARRSLIVPINWSNGEMIAAHGPSSVVAEGYTTPDAQNVIVMQCLENGFEWCLFYEDDTLPPADALIRLDEHMAEMKYPIVSGLYFSKSHPTWPLVFRGRGNGAFMNFTLGDQVMCDGVPTGFVLIHRSILEWFAKNSPKYQIPDGRTISRIFEFPRAAWYDPEQDAYFSTMGTSDLYFCDRILKEKVLSKTGWGHLAKEQYPFLCDTRIFCGHIDINGQRWPHDAEQVLLTGRTRAAHRNENGNGNHHKHRK
jgi:hypothetical protein